MFVLGNFLSAFANVLDIALNVYMWLIFARAVISWVNPDPYNPIVQFLYRITEPVLYPIRRIIPYGMGIDISPMVVFLLIIFLRSFLVTTILELAMRLR